MLDRDSICDANCYRANLISNNSNNNENNYSNIFLYRDFNVNYLRNGSTHDTFYCNSGKRQFQNKLP